MSEVMNDLYKLNSDVSCCWSCKGPVIKHALFCPTCDVIQPPSDIDHFVRLGICRCYVLDLSELDRQYFHFQRLLHPDKFVCHTSKEQILSQAQVTVLNEAYETLKNPLKRAYYLLRLSGCVDIDLITKTTNSDLLMEIMEIHELLNDADTVDEIKVIEDQINAKMILCETSLEKAFVKENLDIAVELTTRLKYFKKLFEESSSRKIYITGINI
jgi:molecular chaperone HscB